MVQNKQKIIALNLASTIVVQGLTFFSAPFFSKLLGTANYGVVSIYGTWAAIFSTVLSLQAASTYAMARTNYPLEDQEKYQSSVLSLSIGSYLLLSFILLLFFSRREDLLGLKRGMLALALVQGLSSYCVSVFHSKCHYEFRALLNFILSVSFSVLNIALSILLIRRFTSDTNYWGRIIGQTTANGLFGLFGVVFILSRGRTLYNKTFWAFTIPLALPSMFHLLAGILLSQADRLMLQRLLDESTVGIYSFSASFGSIMGVLWTAFNNSWAPFYFEYTRSGQIEEMKKRARNYIELFTIITCVFILVSPEVFHLFAVNRDFWSGTAFVPIFTVGHYFVFLYSFPVNYEYYNRKTKLIASATIIAALCNICLNYVLITCIGAIGAVIATAFCHGLQFIIHYIASKRVIKAEFPFSLSMFYGGIIAVLLTAAAYYVCASWVLPRWIAAAAASLFILIRILKRKAIY